METKPTRKQWEEVKELSLTSIRNAKLNLVLSEANLSIAEKELKKLPETVEPTEEDLNACVKEENSEHSS